MIVASWQSCISCLKDELSIQQFNTWIRPLRVLVDSSSDIETFYLLAPNKFILEWVKDNFLSRIRDLVEEACAGEQPPTITLEIADDSKLPASLSLDQALSTSDLVLIPQDTGQVVTQEAMGTDTKVLQADVKPVIQAAPIPASDLPAAPFLASTNLSAKPATSIIRPNTKPDGRLRFKGELNTNYTFNNFIEGKSNQLARAAAAQVASNPGGAYNPLFIYGGVGLGKTHLMHAIGNYLVEQNPNANVVYLHSQTFVGSMVSALQLNAINDFKRYYHSADALLIDDIQFFANKERSQEEFFHTFNAIFEGGRQIIMTCDKYHSEINGLEERLKSRFGWGLSVAVEPPELETRAAILINKANRENVYLPNQEAMFMAQKLRSNVRELEGALKKVMAHSQFLGTEITIPLIKEALKDLLAIQNKLISVDNIQRTVAEYYKIKMADMISKRRNRSIARPRQMAMCLSKDLTNHSLPEIGTMYGDRDHTTVLHACRTINDLKKSSIDISEDYQNLLRSLSS